MKFRSLLLLVAAASASSSALAEAKFSKYTADYYKGVYDQYEGQEVTLKVVFVKPYSYKSDIPDVRFFHAVTADENKKMPGGDIAIAVPIDAGNDLIRRYGTAPSDEEKTRFLKGILRADGHGLWFIDVNGTITKKLDAIRQTVMATPTPTPSASASPEASPAASATPEPAASSNGAEAQRPWWHLW